MKKNTTKLKFIFILIVFLLTSCAQLIDVASKIYYDLNVNISTPSEPKVLSDELKILTGDVNTLSKYPLPQLGDIINGFQVKGIYDYDQRNAKLVLFEHVKTKEATFLISNDDIDRGVTFAFNTLAYDNKGIPHVFEHACLGGSEKYPNANLNSELSSRTYNTYSNAATTQNTTAYMVSSLSDEQLFELYKFRLDGVMNPNILRDSKNLEREAHRYVLYDKSADIVSSGIVYSEMSANESNINRTSYQNALKDMFNNSYMGVNTGGVVDDIKNIELSDLIKFHNTFYHPSNMTTILYGDLDYKKYLKYANEEYFDKYEYRKIDKSDNQYVKNKEFKVTTYDFPASLDEEIDGMTMIQFNVVCDDMSQYESGIFELVLNALSNSDGPIKSRLTEKLSKAEFSINNGLYSPKPFFNIVFSNVEKENVEILKSIVEESFGELIENGIREDILTNVINKIELSNEYIKDSHGFAEASIDFAVRTFGNNGEDLLGQLKYLKGIKDIKDAYKNGYVKNLMEKYLSDSANFCMTVTVPKKGLLEKNAQDRSNNLKQKKLSMSDEEIDELIKKNTAFDEWVKSEASNSLIDLVRVASVSSLEETIHKSYAYEENVEGIRFIRSDIKDINYSNYSLLLDTSGVSHADILKLGLIADLYLELPTTNYKGQKLKSELSKNVSSFAAEESIIKYYDGGYNPYFEFSFIALDKNLDRVFELLKELIYETEFEDVGIVRDVATKSLNRIKNSANSNPYPIGLNTLLSKNEEGYQYENYVKNTGKMEFLKAILLMSDDEIKNLLKDCKDLIESLFNKAGTICTVVGNFDTIIKVKEKSIDLTEYFTYRKINKVNYGEFLSKVNDSVAIVVGGNMEYNMMSISMLKEGEEFDARYKVVEKILNDKILYPEFRVKNSVYGAYSQMGRKDTIVYTYRDPNVKETYDIYKKLYDMLISIKLSDEELEDYKLGAYSQFAYPLTKFESANVSISETLEKCGEKLPDRYLRFQKEIKELNRENLPSYFEIVKKLVENGNKLTIGGKEEIEKNKDLFEEIKYDYIN